MKTSKYYQIYKYRRHTDEDENYIKDRKYRKLESAVNRLDELRARGIQAVASKTYDCN
jgi:hypothetical protein